MLTGKITKNKMGITLMGDERDLESMHNTVHYLMDSFNAPEKEKNYILALAYDIRKAMEGMRIVYKKDGLKNYFGVNILWITYLYQIKYLRYAAGYVPTDKRIQSDLYRIEYLTEEAIKNEDPDVFSRMNEWFTTQFMLPGDFLMDYVLHLDYTLYKTASNPADRFKKLPGVIAELDLFSDMYKKYKDEVLDYAKKNNANPDEITHDYDFPDDDKW